MEHYYFNENAIDEKTELKDYWKIICNQYLKQFCKKHDFYYEPDMWVANNPGTIINIADMFVNMDDIRYDIDNNINPELYCKWYWKSIEVYELTNKTYMNFESYCKGAPDDWPEEKLARIKELKDKLYKMIEERN